jgi:hypothetical protein
MKLAPPDRRIYAARGEADHAFDWLERAYVERDSGLSEIKPNRHFLPIQGDPRWPAFLEKMGFDEGVAG